jgi:uncharacterized protein YxeA
MQDIAYFPSFIITLTLLIVQYFAEKIYFFLRTLANLFQNYYNVIVVQTKTIDTNERDFLMGSNETKTQKLNIRKILIIVIAILAVIYIGVSVFYNGHFFPNTTVNGISCGNKNSAYLEDQNTQEADNFILTVTDRKESKYTISGAQISYTYEKRGEEQALLDAQNGFTWPFGVFIKNNYELTSSFTYDENALYDAVDALEIFDKDYIEEPQNAYLNITDDDYEVVEQVEGNSPIRDEVISEISSAFDTMQPEVTLSDDCYKKPEIYSDDESIANTESQLDKYAASVVTYDIEGANEVVDKAKILSFLDIDDDGNVSVNDEKITTYVQYLASTYNTYGRVRDFKTSKGDTIKIGGGTYGYALNKSGEKEQLLSDLSGGTPVEREPVYELTGLGRGDNDIGDTYVEIDYTNQHLWFYKNGSLVTETDIVSGNISRGNGSSDGIFPVGYKAKDQVLQGENYSSNVDFFIQFSYNVGIHDASWRSTFGGTIYKTSGSHGCINVPRTVAVKIYDEIEAGTPVVAYYRESVKLSAYNNRIDNAYSYSAD